MRIASYFGVLVDDLLCPKKEELILGIDGGGTKTSFAVTTLDGHILSSFSLSGCNPNDMGVSETVNIISRGIIEALNSHHYIRAIFCGIAGVASGGQIPYITEELKRRFPHILISVNSDYANIFAMDEASSIAIISGTGSVVCVKTEGGYSLLGGYGYLLDKAGSGYDIGREAIYTALEDEVLGNSSLISELFKKELNISNVKSAIGPIYKGGKPYIASFAGIVFKAYEMKDPRAIEIIEETARRLAELLNIAVKRYGVSPRAVAGGGLFEHYGEILIGEMSKYTDAKIIVPSHSPIFGACVAARRLYDGNLPSEFWQSLEASYTDKK